VLFLGASPIVNTSMYENLPFNLRRHIAPVSGLIDYPMGDGRAPISPGKKHVIDPQLLYEAPFMGGKAYSSRLTQPVWCKYCERLSQGSQP